MSEKYNKTNSAMRKLIQSSGSAVFIITNEMQLLDYNSMAVRYFDLPASVEGTPSFPDFFQAHDLSCPIKSNPLRISLKQTSIPGKRLTFQWELIPTDNDENEFLLMAEPAPGYKRLANLLTSDILDTMQANIYWKDHESVYYGSNQQMAKATEKNSIKEIINQKDEDFKWGNSAAALQKTDQAIVDFEKPIVIKEIAGDKNSPTTYLSSKSPLYNELNELVGSIGVSIPITETQPPHPPPISQKEIQNFLQQVISLIPGSVYWKDLEGNYMGCNNTFRAMAGLATCEQIIGKNDYDLWSEEQAKHLTVTDMSVLRTLETLTAEERGYLADGTFKVFLSTKAPLYYPENKIIGIVGISIDITQIKEYQNTLAREKERAEQANKAKTEFLASMSHDLRTPLNAIMGFSEILQIRNDLETCEKSDYLNSIHDAAKMLLTLIEGILDYVKVEAGQQKLVAEPMDLLTLIEDIRLMVNLEAEKKNIKLISHYEEDIPRYIISDPHRIRRIVTNLLNNAIKFTHSGHIIISVECLRKKKQQATLQIMIEDTGVGIPSEHITNIFDRFNRGEPSYASRYRGTGLGLSIVKEFVDSLNGKIFVNSQVDKGSTFSVNIPVKLQKNSVRPSMWHKHFSNLHILIIDDHPTRGFYLQRQLGTKNVNLVSAHMARDTLTHSTQTQHIIIIDDEIQSKEFFELAKWIRNNQKFKDSLLLALAQQSQIGQSEKISNAGYNGSLAKPIKISTLSQQLLEHWSAWVSNQDNIDDFMKILNPSVLLVEDDPASAKVASILLKSCHCNVTVAKTAEEAISMLDKHFDIAFIDIGLPDMQGTEVIVKAREILGNLIPLVTLSAHSSEADKNLFIAKGANATLQKPLSFEALKNTLMRFLVTDQSMMTIEN